MWVRNLGLHCLDGFIQSISWDFVTCQQGPGLPRIAVSWMFEWGWGIFFQGDLFSGPASSLSEQFKRGWDRNCNAFYVLPLEVTHYHFYNIVSVTWPDMDQCRMGLHKIWKPGDKDHGGHFGGWLIYITTY